LPRRKETTYAWDFHNKPDSKCTREKGTARMRSDGLVELRTCGFWRKFGFERFVLTRQSDSRNALIRVWPAAMQAQVGNLQVSRRGLVEGNTIRGPRRRYVFLCFKSALATVSAPRTSRLFPLSRRGDKRSAAPRTNGGPDTIWRQKLALQDRCEKPTRTSAPTNSIWLRWEVGKASWENSQGGGFPSSIPSVSRGARTQHDRYSEIAIL